MADIKLKDINELDAWNTKELRKLRMTIKNRISAHELTSSPKELPKTHPLFQMTVTECKVLLEKVKQAEGKKLSQPFK